MKTTDFLKCVPLFQHLSLEDRERLCKLIRTQTVKKGDILFRRGSEGNMLYIVRSGRVKISLLSSSGDEVVLAFFSECDFFGEMALLDGLPRSADAIATEPTELNMLTRDDFLSFLNSTKNAIQAVLLSLSRRLRRTDDLLQDTCFLNISGRFAKKLVELAEMHGKVDGDAIHIHMPLTQRDLASMVGTTRESINKELRALREKGLVNIQENNIVIHNMERLKRRAH